MKRPVLSLQTIYFDDSDRREARRLGTDLYQHLTRSSDDPLNFGVSIPVLVGVRADLVDPEAADTVVLLPVLGPITFGQKRERDRVVEQLAAWHKQLGAGHVLPIPLSQNWRNIERNLLGQQFLTELYGAGDRRLRTLDEIVLAVTRLLEPDRSGMRLFISHAKADLDATGSAAKKIHDHIVTDRTANAFFDSVDLLPGDSLTNQLDAALTRGIVLVVRSDAYSSRVWCQHELLKAKLHGIPTLTLEVLRKGEHRSSPYGGNNMSLVWNKNPAFVASRAMVEWLRSVFFRREAERIREAANLPDDVVVVTRHPELLDLAQGPLHSHFAQLVLHPDPELSFLERQVLKASRPRLQLVTPTTAFRRLLNRSNQAADVSSPLERMQVAMSLSDTPDVDGPEGFTADHVVDATVLITRTLVSAGAAIAYGGDFRKNGFTPLLAQLIEAYNQTALNPAEFLQSYLAAIIPLESAPDNLALTIHHPSRPGAVAEKAIMPAPKRQLQHPPALYFSDMRRFMNLLVDARVILGGATQPRLREGGPGYGGRYPGMAEEAWRALQAGKPLYVVGGYGGAAALVADLIEGKETPPLLQDKTWTRNKYFANNAAAIDSDPYREKLELPLTMDELAEQIRRLAAPLLHSDETSLAWNGLTIEENLLLFHSRDPVTLAALVSKGLLYVAREKNSGKQQIELVNDTVTSASKLDAMAIATIDEVPLGGAGAALDAAIGGRLSAERASGQTLVSLSEATIDAEWLVLASLGRLDDEAGIKERVERAALQTAKQASRHGFERLGVVSFGGSILSDTEAVVDAMLEGFKELPANTTIVWFETNEERFERLKELLESNDNIKLSTRRAMAEARPEAPRKEPVVLNVRLEDGQLSATALLPSGGAVAAIHQTMLTDEELERLSAGRNSGNDVTPDMETLQENGAALAQTLFGKKAGQILDRCRDSQVRVVHDLQASRLPFEMLVTKNPVVRPAVEAGISRRLAVTGVREDSQSDNPPRKDKLNVLLVVNPTRDLPGTLEEAKGVKDILDQQKNRVNLVCLKEKEATRAAVIAALEKADVFHYCGHAYFDSPGANDSGLVLADDTLTGEDLRNIVPLPRVAIVNACEAGRVRGKTGQVRGEVQRVRGEFGTEATAFAELFLRSGVESYLGTYWQVDDKAAAAFAARVYLELALGQPLEAAVLAARNQLYKNKQRDWANYMLYGNGNFKLVSG